jgi:hypothetical protein
MHITQKLMIILHHIINQSLLTTLETADFQDDNIFAVMHEGRGVIWSLEF